MRYVPFNVCSWQNHITHRSEPEFTVCPGQARRVDY
jgi:hypothetical protein